MDILFFSKTSTRVDFALPEPGPTAAHNLTLADQHSTELAPIESEVDVKVHSVKSAIWSVHALKVSFEILAGKIRRECNYFFDTCNKENANQNHSTRIE